MSEELGSNTGAKTRLTGTQAARARASRIPDSRRGFRTRPHRLIHQLAMRRASAFVTLGGREDSEGARALSRGIYRAFLRSSPPLAWGLPPPRMGVDQDCGRALPEDQRDSAACSRLAM